MRRTFGGERGGRKDLWQGGWYHGKKYDLRRVLEKDWEALGPKLRGKLHIWVGEADDYFLNNAVHLLDEFLQKAKPAYEGKITYVPGKDHNWSGISEQDMMKAMAEAVARKKKN